MTVHPWQAHRVGLVLTVLPGLKQSVIAGTIAATATRVTGVGGVLLPAITCPHQSEPIAAALRSLMDQGADLLLVAGASAVVDRRDVGPAGIVAAGGEILHFGMPVDPGNLICLGRIGAIPALVLPGCARSPKLNGIDRVLQRLAAGLPVEGGSTVAAMGVGGLLKDVTARPLPRARATGAPSPVAAVVLAAGQSSRMAPRHKLLEPDGSGVPMVARVVDHVLASRARPVLVVTGHRAAEVAAVLQGRDVTLVHAADYADGLSASLRAGLAALPPSAAAALVVLGDMPLVTGAAMNHLIDTYDAVEGRLIVVPTHDGRPGNPVLWDKRYHPAMMALAGDSGARALLRQHGDAVAEVELDDSVLRDFDTLESLADLAGVTEWHRQAMFPGMDHNASVHVDADGAYIYVLPVPPEGLPAVRGRDLAAAWDAAREAARAARLGQGAAVSFPPCRRLRNRAGFVGPGRRLLGHRGGAGGGAADELRRIALPAPAGAGGPAGPRALGRPAACLRGRAGPAAPGAATAGRRCPSLCGSSVRRSALPRFPRKPARGRPFRSYCMIRLSYLLLAGVLAAAGCSQSPSSASRTSKADAAACRTRTDAIYNQQNRFLLSERNTTDSPYSTSGNPGVTNQRLSQQYGRDELLDSCLTSIAAQGKVDVGAGRPCRGPGARAKGAVRPPPGGIIPLRVETL